ncbi:MAG: UDP-N-acetylmuramoyl-L-alanine--D-glutamate ligase [Candidatus Buchananbacteria bacterium]|nr:UDP-N-acetylmuramoyl-L-alanine--D-glutamate ligase [Candidatus Buchananbacteria bacterium]
MQSRNTAKFVFSNYQFLPAKKVIKFNYHYIFNNGKKLNFTETLNFPNTPKLNLLPKESLKQLLDAIHLMLGISYYKLYCPKTIIQPYKLTGSQADFWTNIYQKGLGEFCFKNKIDPAEIAKFKPTKNSATIASDTEFSNRSLLGIGGGKDSIVAAKFLHQNGFAFAGFVLETQRQSLIINQAITKLKIKKQAITRLLDEKIFQPHENSYNGHIPISAIIAFLSVLNAALFDYRYVIVGNEYSASFGNLNYKGREINHQWSKSLEFETMFQNYIKDNISTGLKYFSLLRPFHELRLAKEFSTEKNFFGSFSSCNHAYKITGKNEKRWCGQCPKCAFVFLMLAPFINKKELIKIFGKNLLADPKLIETYQDLLGFGKLKPFECVGRFEESQAALYLIGQKYPESLVVKKFLSKIKNSARLVSESLASQKVDSVPTPFVFCGMHNAAIIGYGKEGTMTKKYLKKFQPKLKVGTLDSKFDKDYLSKQKDYDIGIKTPGIQKEKIQIPYTTATNLFFSQNQNFTIGVTGTKGKSTTASLIFHLLKTTRHNVELLGNIGKPMLGTLLKDKPNPKKIFVLELSSYQLDDLKYSPDIAIVINLTLEHLDYHGSLKNYNQAKRNITKNQTSDNYFLYLSKNKILSSWAKETKAIKIPFDKVIIKKDLVDQKGVLGNGHYLENIKAAIATVRLLGVNDQDIKKGLKTFKTLPHRLAKVGTFKGITFYDDAISTTPESTIKGIQTLGKVETIFLGGLDRGYDFTNLRKVLKKSGVKNIVLFPDSGKRILESKKGYNILETTSMEQAVMFAYKNTTPGNICLLSTASPSYSVWKNFEEKGDEFIKYIKKLK